MRTLLMNQEEAIRKIDKQIEAIDDLQTLTSNSSKFIKWLDDTEELIEEIFGGKTRFVEDFNAIYFTPFFLSCQSKETVFDEAYLGGLEEARSFLHFLIDEIE
jgi:hypothetical protein